TRDEDEFLFSRILGTHPHRTRLDPGHERHVSRQDAEFTRLARQRDEFRQPGEDLLFRADDVDVTRHSHVVSFSNPRGTEVPRGRTNYCSFFAFSMASSMLPTM